MATNSFDKLVEAIKSQLGAGGISSSDVNSDDLVLLMKNYISQESDWMQYTRPDPSRAYTRHLVDNCNENANILVLCWNPGKESQIHDHSGAHCIMKVLKGRLDETLYLWPEEGHTGPLTIEKETPYREDDVAYIHDKIGLHKIGNVTDEIAISLHLYTPPWAAKYGCQIFDESSGQPHHIKLAMN